MARPLRLEYPGAWWHVVNRGVERRPIFLDDRDRRCFLKILRGALERFHWRLHAYVLMTNHFHLLIETVEPTLSRGMQKVEGGYARAFNVRYARVGHLLQARFKAHLIDSEAYLTTVARYIVLNPVRAGMVARPEQWRWSSHAATAGLSSTPQWLTTTSLLDRFHPSDRREARDAYRRFTAAEESIPRPWDQIVGQLYLGSKEFIACVQERIDAQPRSSEYPRAQREVMRATLAEVWECVAAVTGERPVKSGSRLVRMAYAFVASVETIATLRETGVTLGIGATGVSYLIRCAKEQLERDSAFEVLVREIRLKIRNCTLQT